MKECTVKEDGDDEEDGQRGRWESVSAGTVNTRSSGSEWELVTRNQKLYLMHKYFLKYII